MNNVRIIEFSKNTPNETKYYYIGPEKTGRSSFTYAFMSDPFTSNISWEKSTLSKLLQEGVNTNIFVSIRNPYTRAVALYLADPVQKELSFKDWVRNILPSIPTIGATLRSLVKPGVKVQPLRIEWGIEDVQSVFNEEKINFPSFPNSRNTQLKHYYRDQGTERLVREWGKEDFKIGEYDSTSFLFTDDFL